MTKPANGFLSFIDFCVWVQGKTPTGYTEFRSMTRVTFSDGTYAEFGLDESQIEPPIYTWNPE